MIPEGKRFLGDENMSCHWTPRAQHAACHRWVPTRSVQLNWTGASPEQVCPPPWILTPKDVYERPCLPAETAAGDGLDTLKVPSTASLDCLPRIPGTCGALRLLGPAHTH